MTLEETPKDSLFKCNPEKRGQGQKSPARSLSFEKGRSGKVNTVTPQGGD